LCNQILVSVNLLAVSEALWQRGIWVPAIRPPTVRAGSARLRVTLSASHSDADVDRLVVALTAIGGDMPRFRIAP
jgi:8-amino-7-oxononanoate synthase